MKLIKRKCRALYFSIDEDIVYSLSNIGKPRVLRFDGDIAYTTDNKVLLENWRDLPTIECVQRSAEKKVCTEEDFIKGNKLSFGDSIGSITNVATSMICLQSLFDEDSEEYKELDYRIITMQAFQQDAIDRAKGIISDPMPVYWRSYKENIIQEDDTEETRKRKIFNAKIAADKKPYFMRYRYATSDKEYKQFLDDVDYYYDCKDFNNTKEQILKGDLTLTEEEQRFKNWYYKALPILDSPCVVNKICHVVEDRFDNIKLKRKTKFDYRILKTDKEYHKNTYNKVKKAYDIFKREQVILNSTNSQKFEATIENEKLYRYLAIMLNNICDNKEDLTNILLDICYEKNTPKDIVWVTCGDQIIENLLNKNNRTLCYPKRCEDGDISYIGLNYKMEHITLNNINESEEEAYEN